MPPLVINEEQIFSFKFWFNGHVHYGMYYRNELFCHLARFEIQKRPQVYQLGFKLSQQDALIVITCSTTTCSLWGSLRSPSVKSILLNHTGINLPGSHALENLNPPADQPGVIG